MKFFSSAFITLALAFTGLSAVHVPVESELNARDACFSQGYTIGYANGCGSVTRGRPGHRIREVEDVEAREACTGAAYLVGFNTGMTDGVNACMSFCW